MSTVNKMGRSAHGLDHRGDDWRDRATCATQDPDMWDATIAAAGSRTAAHICLSHCPVRKECLADTVAIGPSLRQSVVLAGIVFGNLGHPNRYQEPAARCQLCTPTHRHSGPLARTTTATPRRGRHTPARTPWMNDGGA